MKRLSSILGSLVVVVVAGGFLLVTLGRIPPSAVVGEALPSSNPGTVPTPSAPDPSPFVMPADCKEPVVMHLTTYDRASDAVSDLATASEAVFQGTIVSIGPAAWNTADGKPGNQATDVRRIATIKVDAAGKGVKDGSTVTVMLPGGTIGCDAYQLQGVADVSVGDSVIVFTQVFGNIDQAALGVGVATVVLPVGADGKVVTPEDGSLTPAALIEKVPKP